MPDVWSPDYPTEKGWYWCKCDGQEPWIVAYSAEMIRPGPELEGKFAGPQLYWFGPILPPEEKPHA